ncbi:PPE family protein [Mycobacterium intracellulare]|uniref:PPE family protein n=1 Tax=Mycobacterium intracellulare subsp. chimaera TaxID=222805 RepID=A0A1Y0T9Q4_MYCIT|nr:PPE family protein [Mycobacterium intracellulare]APD84227.1 PPE family protein [Mycobacterium intracellulare subsp. chimaera]ARV82994.1 PPE family protein [Mycobacterium intracellulare subsp. chimaera]ASL10196.1 PPE family protein [Mycobacterium intracellulare subsp. chimaera]ASL15977.1 PPE family protein [Mycobacterium intracellulare subsp. chimaera]ASL22097.1 PPE family protein [Mycobacterium intracellulare subsp. chimaera]
MDFGELPPEINSGRMYSGPGCGPMLAASAAWDGLAADLHSTSGSYRSVISDLTSAAWLGPASVAMTGAAAPYISWLTMTAALCELAAAQARAAAAAYAAAFAMTVPPSIVAANRTLLMALIATNILGQNTPAIAATEAEYGEMWAQDAGAMYEYAGASAAASALPPFVSPPTTTTPAGATGQVAAVAHTSVTSAGTAAAPLPSFLESLSLLSPVNLTVASASTAITSTGMAGSYGGLGYAAHYDPDGASKMDVVLERLGAVPGSSGAGAAASLGSADGAGSAAAPVLRAALGRASSIGALSVPPSWTAAAPTIRAVAVTWPNALPGALPTVLAANPENTLNEMLLASMAMRGIRGTPPQGRPTITITVTPHPPDNATRSRYGRWAGQP